ncbi:hypothetical protein DICVIV_07571 [Dictyocaulus viviparus]|uniref:Uncharacterized protein n=1 Tax=Dictyocaulus viviparus TaxID=29172 RepID=A0A0D8XVI2_DICVI|nr:hypothetical protein DICVIV_07571 [Dictyocaulus viviparus]
MENQEPHCKSNNCEQLQYERNFKALSSSVGLVLTAQLQGFANDRLLSSLCCASYDSNMSSSDAIQ